MQGVCDARGKFIAVTCKHVGSTNDIQAFETSNLIELNIRQQHPYHWVGDAIYTDTRTLMSPYPGVNLHETDPLKESFNFILSQLRITIERVFGMFVQLRIRTSSALKDEILRIIRERRIVFVRSHHSG